MPLRMPNAPPKIEFIPLTKLCFTSLLNKLSINLSNNKITINKTNVEWSSYEFSPFRNLTSLEEVVIEDLTEIFQYYFSNFNLSLILK